MAAQRAYDIIHAHFIVPTGLVARAISRRHAIPYVVTAHGSDVPGYNPDRFALVHRLIRPAWRRVLGGAVAVTSPSHFVCGLIQRHQHVPVEVIPNAFDSPLLSEVGKELRVLAAARLVERKGIRHLIEALATIGGGAEYVIAGDGPQRALLQEQARALGVSIRFLGQVDREQLAGLYASSSIFVLPSLQENFPMVLLEAMSAGCAIVTTAHPGCVEVVGDTALFVPAAESRPLQEALGMLLADPARVRALGEAARRRAARFASAVVAQQFVRLFERCMQTRH
jgi:glycosyltransferase involved in cell wall biosynthesis